MANGNQVERVNVSKLDNPRIWESGKKGLRKTTILTAVVHYGNGVAISMPVQASALGAPGKFADLTIEPQIPSGVSMTKQVESETLRRVREAYTAYPGIRNVVQDAFTALQQWSPKTGLKTDATTTAADFLGADPVEQPEQPEQEQPETL